MHAEQAELADLGEKLFGQCSRLEPVRDVRQDPIGGKLANGVADQAFLVAELVVDALERMSVGAGSVLRDMA